MPELGKSLASVVSRLPANLQPPVRVVEPDLSPPLPLMPTLAAPNKTPIPKFNKGVQLTQIQKDFSDFIERNHGVGIAAHPVGTGKCIVGESLVQTSKGLISIKDLAPTDDLRPGMHYDLQDCVVGSRLGAEKATEFYFDGVRPTIKAKLELGNYIEGTQEHPVLVMDEREGMVFKKLGEVRIGDYVAVSRGRRIFADGVSIPSVPADASLCALAHNSHPKSSRDFIKAWYPTKDTDWVAQKLGMTKGSVVCLASKMKVRKLLAKNYQHISAMPSRENLFRLLGLMLGDGCITEDNNAMIFTNQDPELLDVVESILSQMGIRCRRRENGERCNDIVINSVELKRFLEKLGLAPGLAPQKSVPFSVLRGSEKDILYFLSGLIDTDGSVVPGSGLSVSISSSSRKLLEQVQVLLLNLGCIPKLRDKYNQEYRRNYFEIVITDRVSLKILASSLSLLVPKKRDRLLSMLSDQRGINTNVDIVPKCGQLLHRMVMEASKNVHYQPWWQNGEWMKCYLEGKENPSYEKLWQILERHRYMAGHAAFKILMDVYSEHYFWSPVAEISKGEAPVYDLVVPGSHSFVANGIVSHNTASMIAAALRLREKGMGGQALVVVPAGLRDNFATSGIKKFTNASVGVIGTSQEIASNRDMDVTAMGPRDFYVISYDMFKKDPEKYLKATGADTVIADELHRAKDEDTEIHKTIERIQPHIKNFIGASASPAMNSPFEAVSLINAISKKKMTPGQFQKEFYERKADGFKDWFFGLFGHEKHGPIVGVKNPAELGRFIGAKYHFAPDIKDPSIPRKKVEVVKVPMSEEQTKLYKAVLQKQLTFRERRILEKGELLDDKVLAPIVNKTMAARQLSNNVGFVRGEVDPLKTPKMLSVLTDVETELEKNPKGQVLLYSQFMDHGVNVMAQALKEAKIPYATFTGREPAEVRDRAVQDYNAGKIKVLIISKAGSQGLNLPNTSFMGLIDGDYNPEMITQIEGRGVRRGGLAYLPPEKRVVKIKRYVSVPDDESLSVDEKLYDIAAKKAELVKMFRRAAESFQRRQEARAAKTTAKKPGKHA